MNRYYTTNRPVTFGTVPSGFVTCGNFDKARYDIPLVSRAHGWVDYAEPLSQADIDSYELVPDLGEWAERIGPAAELIEKRLTALDLDFWVAPFRAALAGGRAKTHAYLHRMFAELHELIKDGTLEADIVEPADSDGLFTAIGDATRITTTT